MTRPRVIVGMSGGVDSAVAAYLLKMAGYDVIGVTLKTWISDDGKESRCCEINDAQRAASQLDIPYHVLNCTQQFDSIVVGPFIDEYIGGRTPNPCIECNRALKWERMLYFAGIMGAQYVATGHYARIVKKENGRVTVQRAVHAEKDQTYMLYRLSQEQLASTLMPLGNLSKDEVRHIAATAGLDVADKKDSQEICFVTDGNYADFILDHAEGPIPREGYFVNEEGEILGKHKGIIHYTVGQRKGLGIAFGYPAFVKEIRPEENEIVIAREEALYGRSVRCENVNFMSISGLEQGESLRCRARIRYHHEAQPALIRMCGENRVQIDFDEPVRAATPGQSAVFYDEEECVIGGGVILPGRDHQEKEVL